MSMDLGTLLVRSPDVCGGRLRIDGTRMTVNQVVIWYKQGHTPEEIGDQYPHLTLAQIYTTLAYYHVNRDEIEEELVAEKIEADQLEQAYQQPPRRA
jgi:uncharacterized protein (DUF433 family)